MENKLQQFAIDNNFKFTTDFGELQGIIDVPPLATSIVYTYSRSDDLTIIAYLVGENLYRYGIDEFNEDPGESFPTTFKELTTLY